MILYICSKNSLKVLINKKKKIKNWPKNKMLAKNIFAASGKKITLDKNIIISINIY